MGLPITVAANGLNTAPQQELSQERSSLRNQQALAQARAAESRSAALERFTEALPGRREPAERPADLQSTVADLERVSLAFSRKLKFTVDHQSHDVIVKVIDSETDKVIKVLPPEELQRLHSRIKETIGFLFDERV
jgi:flagellar protein FlaG